MVYFKYFKALLISFGKWCNNGYMKQKGNGAIFILLLVGIVAGIALVIRSQIAPPPISQQSKAPAAFGPLVPLATDTDVHNPDGTMKLVMHTERQTDGTAIYTFFTADISGENKKLIFTKTQPKEVSMVLHHNSFSPDNKLVIVEEHTGAMVTYFVLKVDGTPFANGSQYLDINGTYKEKDIKYSFNSVTGWAGPTLAIVTTTKDDGTKGPSFWFVTDTRAFLQLAR